MIEELDDKDRTYILAGKKKWKYLEYSPTAYMFVVFLYWKLEEYDTFFFETNR